MNSHIEKLKANGFTLLRRDTIGFEDIHHAESGEVLSVWYQNTDIGGTLFKAGSLVDFDLLAKAVVQMVEGT